MKKGLDNEALFEMWLPDPEPDDQEYSRTPPQQRDP